MSTGLNRIYLGDCAETMKALPAGIANTCVTSPPYFGLRDYQHAGQIGLEDSPEEYVARLVDVFRGVRRLLRDDGTLWLNLGDSYAGSWGAQGRRDSSTNASAVSRNQIENHPKKASRTGTLKSAGVKQKDLYGIPWSVAFALRADGWYLRQDIIWAKPNPMPESITDRCTKSHEYLFLLAKSERYYYDQEAIAEPVALSSMDRMGQDNIDRQAGSDRVPGKPNGPMHAVLKRSGNKARKPASARGVPVDTGGETGGAVAGSIPWEGSTRNKRSVWTVTTKPFDEAHFATFPEDLIAPCILAGAPRGGVCPRPVHGGRHYGARSRPPQPRLHRVRTEQGLHRHRGTADRRRGRAGQDVLGEII